MSNQDKPDVEIVEPRIIPQEDADMGDLREEVEDTLEGLRGEVWAEIEEDLNARPLEEVLAAIAEEFEAIGSQVEILEIVKDENGEPTSVRFKHHCKSNLIVNGARKALARLLGEYPASNNWQVTVFKLGTEGSVPGDILTPIPPSVTDITLIDTTPFTKRFDEVGVCSIDPSQNFNPTLCANALGTWTPDPTSVAFLPSGAETSVRFKMVMEKGEGNTHVNPPYNGTVPYTEAGLFCQNGTMFARETFPVLAKTAQRKITFLWSILF